MASAQTASAIASVSTTWGRYWFYVRTLLLRRDRQWLVTQGWDSMLQTPEQTHPNLYRLAGNDRPLDLLKPDCAISGGFGAR